MARFGSPMPNDVSVPRTPGAVGSGLIGDIQPATVVRPIARGERVTDLFDELKQLTFQSRTADSPIGLEHAIVSRTDGTRWLVRGGQEGIDFSQFSDYRRLLVHTHGRPTGPSFDADIPFLRANNQ